jgi:hypothetical protein
MYAREASSRGEHVDLDAAEARARGLLQRLSCCCCDGEANQVNAMNCSRFANVSSAVNEYAGREGGVKDDHLVETLSEFIGRRPLKEIFWKM